VDINTGSTSLTGTVASLSLSGDSPSITVRTSSGATLQNIALSQITAVR
jgi:flagellar basal-body rod modification protein FlgD